mgnify:CR=1 FL=1
MSGPRLYWRVKVNEKWTWRAAVYDFQDDVHGGEPDPQGNSVPIGMQCIVWFPQGEDE